jgi:hypothetical protein
VWLHLERVERIELSRSAWEADRLPLHHTRPMLGAMYRTGASAQAEMGVFVRSLRSICDLDPETRDGAGLSGERFTHRPHSTVIFDVSLYLLEAYLLFRANDEALLLNAR